MRHPEEIEFAKKVEKLRKALATVGAVVIVSDVILYYEGVLNGLLALILNPAAVLSFYFILFYKFPHIRERGHSKMENEFARASIMLVGMGVVALGGALFLDSFVASNFLGVTFDTFLGSGFFVLGNYVVFRYA